MEEINNKAKIISISLTAQEKEWLDDMEISPTALMKQKITEMMTSSIAQRKRIKELEEKIENFVKRIDGLYSFLEEKGLTDEYLNRNG